MTIHRLILAFMVLILPLFAVGQMEKKLYSKVTEQKIPFGKDTFSIPYISVYAPEGLVKLSTKITDTAQYYPLIVIQAGYAEPFLGVLNMHLAHTKTLSDINQKQADRLHVLEEKERTWKDMDTLKNDQITYLKKYNSDLKSINDTFSMQFKIAISTAKEANKGWSWQGFKDLILGTAAGLAIGLLIGLTR
jgi:ElaB/YqjD/DUF883 family membrane-anchored ribosome-binding protein